MEDLKPRLHRSPKRKVTLTDSSESYTDNVTTDETKVLVEMPMRRIIHPAKTFFNVRESHRPEAGNVAN